MYSDWRWKACWASTKASARNRCMQWLSLQVREYRAATTPGCRGGIVRYACAIVAPKPRKQVQWGSAPSLLSAAQPLAGPTAPETNGSHATHHNPMCLVVAEASYAMLVPSWPPNRASKYNGDQLLHYYLQRSRSLVPLHLKPTGAMPRTTTPCA